MRFAQANGMAVRGHNLLWHADNPAWLTLGGYSSAWLYTTLQNHITTVVNHYRGQVFAWDVVNEAMGDSGTLRDSIWYDQPGIGLSGTDYIKQAFLWAHAADPNALLFYNDYSIEDQYCSNGVSSGPGTKFPAVVARPAPSWRTTSRKSPRWAWRRTSRKWMSRSRTPRPPRSRLRPRRTNGS